MCTQINHTVYTLADPHTKDIFYVGVTGDLEKRASAHRNRLRFDVLVEAVETIQSDCDDFFSALKVEAFWIEQFRQWGFELTNKVGNLNYKPLKIRKIRQPSKFLIECNKILENNRTKMSVLDLGFIASKCGTSLLNVDKYFKGRGKDDSMAFKILHQFNNILETRKKDLKRAENIAA